MYATDQIQTERLLLRPPTEADAPAIFERYGQDAEVARYMSWKPHQSIEDTLDFLRRIVGDNASRRSNGYLIFARGDRTLLGSIGGLIEGNRVQFGYLLARDAWGHGFATEAARAFVTTVFADPAIIRMQAFCEINNAASAHVLEKSGFACEGTLRSYLQMPNLGPKPRDVFLYARLRT
jgi:ribosomal-protein-alanine N-acetyltransferase